MSSDNTLSRLQIEVAKLLNRESVPTDIGLAELGFDSMKIVELMLTCDSIYQGTDIQAAALDIDRFTTLTDLDRKLSGSSVAAVA